MVKDQQVETDTHEVIWEDHVEVDEFLEVHVLQKKARPTTSSRLRALRPLTSSSRNCHSRTRRCQMTTAIGRTRTTGSSRRM
jgi:hypothetical protein